MLETVRKNYWKPDKKVTETLAKEYAETVKDIGLACCDHTCNNPLLAKFTSSVLMSVPGLKNQVHGFMKALDMIKNPQTESNLITHHSSPVTRRSIAPDGKGKKVEGYEMQNITASGASSAPIPYLFFIGFLIFIGLIALGWRRKAGSDIF
jgi:cobaltochelatase CobN